MRTALSACAAVRIATPLIWVLVAAEVRADYAVQRVASGLNQPTYVTQAPGDNTSLYIVERNDGNNQLGRIRKLDQMTGALTTFLDVEGIVQEDGGLMGVTFHPDFATNGLFYVLACSSRPGGTNGRTNYLDEYQLVGGSPQLQRTILQYTNPIHAWHTIDQVHFRPNGNNNEMFVLTGDGGTQASEGGFNPALIESPDSIYGKILRVNLNADYSTPANAATHPGIDVVALGIRNPYRSSFDRATGDFYFGDVGFTTAEELNFIPASHINNAAATPLDFGWTSREGTVATAPAPPGGPGSPGDLNPIFDYPHPGRSVAHSAPFTGLAVIGGYVYRGPVAELQGRYFFAEHIFGNVYSGTFNTSTDPATYNGTNLTNVVDHTTNFESRIGGGANIQFVTSYGEDLAGNLYIVKIGTSSYPPIGTGEIFRVVPLLNANLQADINRDTGVITLTNQGANSVAFTALGIGSAFGALNPAALLPISGHYDNQGTGSIDNNNAWSVTSPNGSHTELREQSLGDAGAFGPGQQIQLASIDGWAPSPTEDVYIAVLLDNGIVAKANVIFSGNGGQKFKRSDLDFDNDLDASDWSIFKLNHRQTLSVGSLAEAYALGDLNADGENNFFDFRLFQADYIAVNGAAAFAALNAEIPEPASIMLLVMGASFCALLRRRTNA